MLILSDILLKNSQHRIKLPKWPLLNFQNGRSAHFRCCHVADRPTGLDRLELFEAPFQLLQSLTGELSELSVCKRTHVRRSTHRQIYFGNPISSKLQECLGLQSRPICFPCHVCLYSGPGIKGQKV